MHDRAIRHLHDQVSAGAALTVAACPARTVSGFEVCPEVEVQQRVYGRVDHQDDRAAVPAVAAVRAAHRLELLAQDRDTAVPAVARLDVEHDSVHECGHWNFLSQ